MISKNTQITGDKLWMNGQEAAKYLGVSYNTFLSVRRAGKIRYHQFSKQTILYHRDELTEDIKLI